MGVSLAAVAVTATPAVGGDWWGSVQCGQSEPPKKRREATGPDGTADGRGADVVRRRDGQQQDGGASQPSPAQLAQVAREQLRLPSPRIEASPVVEQLVQLPTWLWLDRQVLATLSVQGCR
ncbi:hypothetical protein [Streptomyces acidiscabies]|uniref:Secreted protein n=1 Tax=Streptomyces acidiscabies TaxID=42234 RepID=A0AAP6BMF0_9ACTN|nr:hypothetical protein [Streptomyces acidiscabies]MBP5941275.1 hypothetical protein [Streptomyces sp. LBUM 1476]MBZ3912620.1 hypothetical protein [Streptomyces acidiscabies]MDX2967365.1 hypothetical protein [Streptomyces acidiscabies]MDX3018469.1 hypothetical protein [Streptomyces acidiscabies]MDX3796283.1 hypothetical protein [Streptomyces acidiscabies]